MTVVPNPERDGVVTSGPFRSSPNKTEHCLGLILDLDIRPGEGDAALWHRKRTVFYRIGSQFMQRQAEVLDRFRLDHEILSGNLKLFCRLREGLQVNVDDPAERGTGPLFACQKLDRTDEPVEAIGTADWKPSTLSACLASWRIIAWASVSRFFVRCTSSCIMKCRRSSVWLRSNEALDRATATWFASMTLVSICALLFGPRPCCLPCRLYRGS